MQNPSVVHSTFVLERHYPVSSERVFQAFANAQEKRRWFAEGDTHEVEEFAMDFRPGGVDRARYRYKEGSPIPGAVIHYQGTYQDIVPARRLVTASTMSFGEKPFSASLLTIELLPAGTGTDLICTHQGAFFEGSDGPQMREQGWRSLFEKLGNELARS